MNALTSLLILFSAKTPDPATPTPTEAPPATAAEPAMTTEVIDSFATAVCSSAPDDTTLVSCRYARTCAGVGEPSLGFQPM